MINKIIYKWILTIGIVVIAFTGCTGQNSTLSSEYGKIIISNALHEDENETIASSEENTDVEIFELSNNFIEENNNKNITPIKISDKYKKITSKDKVIQYNTGTIIIGDTGYEQYNYVSEKAEQYTDCINKITEKFSKKINIYDMIVPTSIGITLPDNKFNEANSSDQNKAIQNMYKMLSDKVIPVNIYNELMKHRTEYIYYRTDHHWTSKGAYYAYSVLCKIKGAKPNSIDKYKQASFGEFKGSFYNETNNSPNLKADTLKVLYPINNKKISIEYTTESGSTFTGNVIADASSFSKGAKYSAYIHGDNPYTVVTNKEIKKGKSCIVVKESFGNALVPFLADNYSNIYVIDYRYWQGSLSKLAQEKDISDVYFINNISMTRSSYLIGKLTQLLEAM